MKKTIKKRVTKFLCNKVFKLGYFVTLLLCYTATSSAQTFPYGINYQAVARDANGNAKSNSSVPLRFTIYKTSATGTIVWQETQTPPNTNAMGQFNAVIGTGQAVNPFTAASFSQIKWANDSYFLKVEIQTGISTFVQIGTTTQFESVPYALAAPDPTPAGVVSAFVGVSAPTGYIMCKGQAVSRTGIYANLFAVIGTAYGNGDGSTTFNVPDFRGMFLRGTDSLATNDPNAATRTAANGGNTGAKLGSYEADAFQGHYHSISSNAQNLGGGSGGQNGSGFIANPATTTIGSPITDGTNGTPHTASETRPKNVYVNYIIKY